MAVQQAEVTWPAGLRSEPVTREVLGMWRPLMAVLAGFILPALPAWGMLSIAGAGGEDIWLRQQILWVLYALGAAPVIAWLSLPVSWPLLTFMALRGWAGASSAGAAALLLGLPVVHVVLHGDITSEDTTILPHLALALLLQGLTTWAVLWALVHRRANRADYGNSR